MFGRLLLLCTVLLTATNINARGERSGLGYDTNNDVSFSRRSLRDLGESNGKGGKTSREAPCDRFPYMVSVRQTNPKRHLCSGVLVNSEWVMTASECLNFADDNPVIYIGLCSVSQDPDDVAVRRGIQYVAYPQSLVGQKTVTLIKLSEPVTADTPKLDQNPVFADEKLSLLGFGFPKIKIGDPVFGSLKIEKQVVVGTGECGEGSKTKETFCATNMQHKASCIGDSGSPLLSMDATDTVEIGRPSSDVLVGLLVGGGSCPNDKLPEVSVNVMEIKSWILETIGSVNR